MFQPTIADRCNAYLPCCAEAAEIQCFKGAAGKEHAAVEEGGVALGWGAGREELSVAWGEETEVDVFASCEREREAGV